MRYLGNNTNIVRDADLTATNAIGSSVIYRTDSAPKSGGGRVSIAGPYTGAEDAAIDVEIVDLAGSAVHVSQPVFAGVGNGAMSDASADDVLPQTVTVTLEDLGTDTRSAYAPFQGVTLTAKAAGAGGNAIAIDVDHSGLVSSPTQWALQEDLRQDANEYLGDHWNFGAAVLEPAGTIPADAPRLTFGNDPQVYRQYKRYRDGRYVYSFAPAPVRDVTRGARVHAVCGTRTLTISDGGAPEVLSGLITLYDALTAIRDQSSLVRVDGPIVNDRLPGGQGTTELSVRTRSYVLGVTTSGTGAIEHAELAVAAQDTAPTETLTLTCADASLPGSEKWDVRGDVSGPLARATTGVAYSDGKYTLTIPLPEIDPSATSGVMVVEYLPEGEHGAEDPIPSLCVDRPRLGIAARDGEWNFIYVRRPPDDCDCTTGDLEGGPKDECLGTTQEGGSMSEASVVIRAQRLTARVRELVGSNTPGVPMEAYLTDRGDVTMCLTTAGILKNALVSILAGTVSHPGWVASHDYAQDVVIEVDGRRYAATTPGASGADAPTFAHADVGDTTADGAVTWTYQGLVPFLAWDEALEQWSSEMALLGAIGGGGSAVCEEWAANVERFGCGYPTVRNGHTYNALSGTGKLTGATEPTWPTDGSTIVDGEVTWQDAGAYWTATDAVAKGAIAIPGTGMIMVAVEAGTTGASEPTWPSVASVTVVDGTVSWRSVPAGSVPWTGANVPPAEYYERWKSIAADVLAAAEITPDFEVAGSNGDGCWRDFDDSDYWWAFDGREPYLPIQTGHYYHAARMGMDETGRPYAQSTREFGFGPRFGCPEYLREGDKIRITITGASGAGGRGYQVGDAFAVRVNQAGPLPFGGGQTGDDTLTWSVVCSQDGRQPDYTLVTTAPAPYSTSIGSGTLGFAIAPGGIPFALGDRFEFSIEGGRFRWRRDGGDWSAPADIADTLLGDGLFAQFVGGAAPSWAAGDRWSFAVEAVNGIAQLRTPIDGEFAWEGETTIDVAAGGPIAGVLIAAHRIPADATITLLGSDDDFVSTPLAVQVPWRRDIIWLAVSASHAAYRITIDRGGAARWLYLGPGTQMTIRTGHAELGRLTKRVRLPGVGTRRALAAQVDHSALPQGPLDALLAMLEHACEFDDRILGIVPNDAEAEAGLVRIADEPIEVEDTLAFQPRDPVHRRQSLTLQLEAMP